MMISDKQHDRAVIFLIPGEQARSYDSLPSEIVSHLEVIMEGRPQEECE